MAKALRTIIGTKDQKTIKLTIFDDGTSKVETVGYGGASCFNDPTIKAIEAGLGQSLEVEKTKEFFQAPAQATNAQKAGQ